MNGTCTCDMSGVLSTLEFGSCVDQAVEANEESVSFVALFLIGHGPERRAIAEALAGDVDPADVVGCDGPDRLAVLTSVATPAAAIARGERLVKVGPSPSAVGLALHPSHVGDPAPLLDTARRALRAAMRDGRRDWAAA